MADRLHAEQNLLPGHSITSGNGKYNLTLQGDGNLVLYTAWGRPVWDSGTWDRPAHARPVEAHMQADGNFVLYAPSRVPQWDTGTWDDNAQNGFIVLQDDRNLVLYAPDGRAVWASNTGIAHRTVITHSEKQGVGYQKEMSVEAKLFRNGLLMCDMYSKTWSWHAGLRPRFLVIAIDEDGHQIWVSKEFAGKTRCSVPDFSCASEGRQFFSDQFPEAIGKYTEHLDIYMEDNNTIKSFRDRTIDFIKAAKDVAQEVKDAWAHLQK